MANNLPTILKQLERMGLPLQKGDLDLHMTVAQGDGVNEWKRENPHIHPERTLFKRIEGEPTMVALYYQAATTP